MKYPFSCCLIQDGGSMSLTVTTTAQVFPDRIEIEGECDTTIYRNQAGGDRCVLQSQRFTETEGMNIYHEVLTLGENRFSSSHSKMSSLFVGKTYEQIEQQLYRKHEEQCRSRAMALLTFFIVVFLIALLF